MNADAAYPENAHPMYSEESRTTMHFGDWLKRYRAICRLTQQEVAEALGYAEITYQRVERGGTPSAAFVDRLIAYLCVPPDEHADFHRFALTHEHPDTDALLTQLTEIKAPLETAITHIPISVHYQALPPPPTTPPMLDLVGRQEELSHYAAELATRHLTVITGMSGVGKTALASALARQSAQPDHIFWYQFYPQTGLADFLWRLTSFLAWHGEDALWQQQHTNTHAVGATLSMDAQTAYLIHALQDHDFLLCLDDLHYVEDHEEVMSFIERLVPTLPTSSLALIVIARSQPNFRQLHPTNPLTGLSLADTQTLLTTQQHCLPVPVLANLHRITDGNPALLILAMETLQTTTTPHCVVQRLAQTPNVMHYLMTRIHQQLDHDPRAVQVMRAIAVLWGSPTTRDAIAAVVEDDEVWDALYNLGRRHLVQLQHVSIESQYSQHTIVQAFYYDQIGPQARRIMHLRAAEYYAQDTQTLLYALHHFGQAGVYEPLVDLLTPNLWSLINQGAAPVLRDLLAAVKPNLLPPMQQTALWIAQGVVATILRANTTAHAQYQHAWEHLKWLPDTPTTHQQRVQVCQGMGDLLEYEQPQEAIRWLRQGLTVLSAPAPIEAGRLHLRLGAVYTLLAKYADAHQALTTSLRLLPIHYEYERSQALNCLGSLACMQSQFRQGQNYFTQALQIYQDTGQIWSTLVVRQNLMILLQIGGQWPEAVTMGTQALTLAGRLHNIVLQTKVSHNLGILHTKQGDFTAAYHLLTQSLSLAQQHFMNATVVAIQASLADMYVRTGEYDAAAHTLVSATNMADKLSVTDQRAEMARTQALIHLARGDGELALTCAQEAVHYAEALGDQIGCGISWRVLGQVQCAQGYYDQAYYSFTRSLALVQDDSYETAQTQWHWGKVLLMTHNSEESMPRLHAAQTIFEQLGVTHDMVGTSRILVDLHIHHDMNSRR